MTAHDVATFWREAGPAKWFARDDAFDAAIRERFFPLHESAARGELSGWEVAAESTLALLILLDQFPRNLFRGSAHAFATDPAARAIADRAIGRGFDQQTDAPMRSFFYLPFMHSEDLADQMRCVALYEALGHPENLKFAVIHRDIIAQFGRFPHRNRCLGRQTTAAEQAFLDAGGFAG